ncbi:hypothetical protein MnTg02_00729 [bacterium MnTg02]|nr:hypothetical protein MnTg02_00729 [bacterium MnTg02]
MAKDTRPLTARAISDIENRAHVLADRMPVLLVEARRVAQTVAHGIHGRRRAGPGETFWQFRQFESSDTATLIDWRRSASSDHLYVREREWEAAHTVWLWPDLTRSMEFRSHLSQTSKIERGLLLTFALAELLVQAGERVGLLGVMPPSASRNTVSRMAQWIAQHDAGEAAPFSATGGLKPKSFSDCVLFSDFLDPVEKTVRSLKAIASESVRCHVVQILDPAEESLPYSGRTEFESHDGNHRVLTGRAETLRDQYIAKLISHRDALKSQLKRLECSFFLHHTDRPAGEALLAIHTRLTGMDKDYRHLPQRTNEAESTPSEQTHERPGP